MTVEARAREKQWKTGSGGGGYLRCDERDLEVWVASLRDVHGIAYRTGRMFLSRLLRDE